MSNDNGALEVSAMVWFDDDGDEWMHSLFVIHDNREEELHSWGASSTKDEAVVALNHEIIDYFRGV